MNGSGGIGVEELLEPMMGLGFIDNEMQIRKMIDEVDSDEKSGEVEF